VKSKFPSCKPQGRIAVRWSALTAVALVACAGCTSFNPAFVDLLDSSGQGSYATLDNAPGHVVIAFVNNAVVDERIIAYLESGEGGSLLLTDAEKRSLKPLIRYRLLVTFTDGTDQIIEFISGSRFVEPLFSQLTEQDLDQLDFTTAVVLCDVQRVELAPETPIEVFIPVMLDEYNWVDPTETAPGFWRYISSRDPGFRELNVDSVAADGQTLYANIGVRDTIAPIANPGCGNSISVVVSGVLSVPFTLDAVSGRPNYDIDDAQTIARVGGRYSFTVTIR